MNYKGGFNIKKFLTLTLTIILILFPSIAIANTDYYRSLFNVHDDYLKFGNDEYLRSVENGIILEVDESSVSHSRIHLIVRMQDVTLISQRKIDKFYVLYNNKIVHEWYPQREYIDWLNREDWATYYAVVPASHDFIGGYVNIQIVGVEIDYGIFGDNSNAYSEYVVAWSSLSDTIRFKDFPVVDNTAVWWLSQQFYKLQEILEKLNSMDNKLANISKQLETMLTPSAEAQSRLDKAQEELWEAMPMKQVSDQTKDMSNMITRTTLKNPKEELVFGDKRDWFMVGVEVNLLDLTEMVTHIDKIRKLLQAIIWMEFFFFLVNRLAPKLDL